MSFRRLPLSLSDPAFPVVYIYFSSMNIRFFLALFFTFNIQALYAQDAKEGEKQTATETKPDVKPDQEKPDQKVSSNKPEAKQKVKAVPQSTRQAKPTKVTKGRPSSARPSGARPPQSARPTKRPVKPGNGRK